MYGEEKFLKDVQVLIALYRKGPVLSITDSSVGTMLTKEGVTNTIKELGSLHWVDEELIQDQINKL